MLESPTFRVVGSLLVAVAFAFALVAGVLTLSEAFSGAPGDITIGEDTRHKADIVLQGNQRLTVEDATLLVDGNLTLMNRASLVLRNATLVLEERSIEVPVAGEPGAYRRFGTDYSVLLSGESRIEVYNSQLLNATEEHWRLILTERSSLFADGMYTEETVLVRDSASVHLRNAHRVYPRVSAFGSEITIEDASLRGLFLRGSSRVILRNVSSTEPLSGHLTFQGFTGQFHAEALVWAGDLEVGWDNDARISGNLTFGTTSLLRLPERVGGTGPDLESAWPPVGRIVRHYPIIVRLGSQPQPGIEVAIFDGNGTLISSGKTDDTGLVVLPISFWTESWQGSFRLEVEQTEGQNPVSLSLMSSTPVTITL